MKFNLFLLLLLTSLCANAQAWENLPYSANQPGLEQNPLKGLSALFGSDNGFPHTVSGHTFTLGEVMNGIDDFNFETVIDPVLEREACLGRTVILQINVDSGKKINPLNPTSSPAPPLDLECSQDPAGDSCPQFPNPPAESYLGERYDLPPSLNAVPRIYYLGRRENDGAGQPIPQITGTTPNGFEVLPEDSEDGAGNGSIVVNYNDEVLMTALLNLIENLGQRYNNDDRVFLMHYGTYGIFGEWQLGFGKKYTPGYVPNVSESDWAMTDANQQRIIDKFQESFPDKKLIARVPDLPEPESVGYSDGLFFGGSLSEKPADEFFFFLPKFKTAGVDLNWKSHPIGGEIDPFLQPSLWDQPNLAPDDFNYELVGDRSFLGKNPTPQNIEQVFLQTHPTFLFQNFVMQKEFLDNPQYCDGNNANGECPTEECEQNNPGLWDKALEASKRAGYTFYVDQFKVSAANGKPAIELTIQNLGVAPMYADWSVAFGYLTAGSNEVQTLGTSDSWKLSAIQPNSGSNYRAFVSGITAPANEDLTFVFKIINPYENYPEAKVIPVTFANANMGADAEGWLTLGQATIPASGNLGAVPNPLTSFELTPTQAVMGLNDVLDLEAINFLPSNASNNSIAWTSSGPGAVSVDANGRLTSRLAGGMATITAVAQNGGVTRMAEIEVQPFWRIPAVVQAEGYSSTENVTRDIKLFGPDAGGEQFVLGFLGQNNILKYDVEVAGSPGETTEFVLEFSANAPFGTFGSAVVDVLDGNDNVLVQDFMFNPSTPSDFFLFRFGDNSQYATYRTAPITLGAGRQEIKIVVKEAAFNLDWIEFKENPCLNFDNSLDGTSCDDGDAGTRVDVYADCECVGVPEDQFTAIPATIEAEDFFDALNVSTLTPSSDCRGGIRDVTNITDDSWIDYPVFVAPEDDNKQFVIDFRFKSSEFPGNAVLNILGNNGADLIGAPVSLPPTSGVYEFHTSPVFTLPAGYHNIRLDVVTSAFDLNWIDIRFVTDPAPNPGDCNNLCEYEGFTGATSTFTLVSGAFGTANPAYEFLGQGSERDTLTVGGVDDSAASNLSLAVSKDFVTTGTTDVEVSLQYELTVGKQFVPGQWTRAILMIDGTAVPFQGNDFLFELFGVEANDNCRVIESGRQRINLTVSGLAEGNHTLTLGLLNNFKTQVEDISKLIIDQVGIFQICPPLDCTVGAICDDGDANTIGDVFDANCTCAGTPATDPFVLIPSLIEAEDFFAWNPAGANNTNDAPAGETGGKVIDFIGDDTSLDYAVRVATPANFVLDFRASSPTGQFGNAIVNVVDENGTILATVSFEQPTANSNTYATYTSDPFPLPATDQVLTLDVVTSDFNLNWIEFRLDDGNGPGPGDCTPLSLVETFDNTTGAYTVSSGAFSSPLPGYESTAQGADNITLTVGGVDNSTQTDMSVGLSTTFTASGTEDVLIQVDYELISTAEYENDEWAQAIVEVDGQRLAYNGNLYLSELVGGEPSTTGAQSATLTLSGLAEGEHTLVVGILNNKKTYNNEVSSLVVDGITISQACTPVDCTVGAICNDGDDNTTNDVFDANCNCAGTPAPDPFVAIPSLIEAEDFFAWNPAGAFNTNDAPAGETGGKVIDFIGDDTSLDYAVRVATPANFVLDFRASSPTGQFGNAIVNVVDQSGTILAAVSFEPQTANINTYATYTSDPFPLPATDQVLTLDVVTSDFNLNWIEFRLDEGNGPGPGDCTPLSLVETFDNTTGAYTVSSGAFSSPLPGYESTAQGADNITLTVGGVDNSTQTDMSVGLSTTFTASGTEDVLIQVDYELISTAEYENDEWAQAIVEVDGQRLAYNGNLYLSELVGGEPSTTGAQSATLTLSGLAEGDHTLVVGILNNKKTYNNEVSSLVVDGITITQACTPVDCTVGAICNDGDDNTTNDVFDANCNCAGTPAADPFVAIPSLIEAEDFFAWNPAGAFNTNDAPVGETGGKIIDFIGDDTSLDYAVRVATPANFVLDFRASSPTGQFGNAVVNVVDQNGTVLTSVSFEPQTADINTYATYTSDPFPLPATDQVLTLDVVTSDFNLNWIEFRLDDGNGSGNCTPLSLVEAFSNTTGAYTVSSGAFSSPQPSYESTAQGANNITLTVGGVDNSTQTDMSVGLSTIFTTSGPEDVLIQVDYELTANSGYENDEWTQAIIEVDGQRLAYNGNLYLSELVGGEPSTTGAQSAMLTLSGLAEGDHTLTVGLLNNKKTYVNESSSMIIDRVEIAQACTPSNSLAVGESGNSRTGSAPQVGHTHPNMSKVVEHAVWPNPFLNRVILRLHQDVQYKRVYIQNLNGAIMANVGQKSAFSGDELAMEVNGPSGIYFMFIETSDGVEVKKIIKR